MKIAFVCLNMEKGGAERVIATLANELSNSNDVFIMTLMNGESSYELDSKVRKISIDGSNCKYDNRIKINLKKVSLMRSRRLRKELERENPDVIIAFLPEPSLRVMLVSKFSRKIRKIPIIVSVRNDPRQEYKNTLIRRLAKVLYKDVDGMVYQTEEAKNYFKNIIKTTSQVVISNPISNSILLKPKADGRRKNVIVTVGRLEEQKNQELLISAFNDIPKNKRRGYILEIYGEGARRRTLQDMINRLGLNENVFLRGKTDDVARVLNNSRIFVLSSLYEGLPNALLEAMALGLPCISTDCPCGGPRSLIKDNENGLLVENKNEGALSEAICKLINNDGLRKKIAKNALLIRESNDIIVIVKKWEKIIDSSIKNKVKNYER